MAHQANNQFEKGKHTITIQLDAASYAALKKATQLQCGERDAGDQIGVTELRRFVRIATHVVALAAIRAGEMPQQVSADLREESQQEYRERIHLLLNPQHVHTDFFGCPPVKVAQTAHADFWKGFRRGN